LLGLILKNKARGKKLIWTSLILLYIFSNQFIHNQVNGIWEPPMTNLESIQGKYPVGVVLGGYSIMAPAAHQVNFNEAADRLVTGLELYQQKKIKKILFCGGHGNIFHDTPPEGQYIAELALRLNIPKKDILVESASKNTWQNAVNCKVVLDSLEITGPVLLITSCTHMSRSLACFNKVGIEAVPVCVDGISGKHKWLFDYLFLPDAYIIMSWNRVIHEWIGTVVYKLMGYN
tara:strand:- start:11400 stop:12095 length:696 start_codon:yes stop_codon:yes gene_type:complete